MLVCQLYLLAIIQHAYFEFVQYGELASWIEDHKETPPPDDLDTPFVFGHDSKIDHNTGEIDFKMFLTTRRMLQLGAEVRQIQLDGTYKLNASNFPLLVMGTSDMKRAFFPLGCCVTKHEDMNSYKFMLESLLDAVRNVAVQDGTILTTVFWLMPHFRFETQLKMFRSRFGNVLLPCAEAACGTVAKKANRKCC